MTEDVRDVLGLKTQIALLATMEDLKTHKELVLVKIDTITTHNNFNASGAINFAMSAHQGKQILARNACKIHILCDHQLAAFCVLKGLILALIQFV